MKPFLTLGVSEFEWKLVRGLETFLEEMMLGPCFLKSGELQAIIDQFRVWRDNDVQTAAWSLEVQ